MLMSYYNKFYHLDRVGRINDPDMSRFYSDCQHKFLNDNDVIQILFGVVEKTGVYPNTLDVQGNNTWPPEILNLVSALNTSHPVASPTPNGLDPLNYIKSRYDQFDGDMDSFMNQLADEYNSAYRAIEVEKRAAEPPAGSEPPAK